MTTYTPSPALREAAQAVVLRWDTPAWKDVPHTARRLRDFADAILAAKGQP